MQLDTSGSWFKNIWFNSSHSFLRFFAATGTIITGVFSSAKHSHWNNPLLRMLKSSMSGTPNLSSGLSLLELTFGAMIPLFSAQSKIIPRSRLRVSQAKGWFNFSPHSNVCSVVVYLWRISLRGPRIPSEEIVVFFEESKLLQKISTYLVNRSRRNVQEKIPILSSISGTEKSHKIIINPRFRTALLQIYRITHPEHLT